MSSETQNIHITTTGTVEKPDIPAANHEESGLLTINGTLVVIVVSFVIFVLLMQKVFYAPMNEIRKRRNNYLKKMKDEANQAFLKAEKLNDEYQDSIRNARKNVSKKTTNLLNEANEEKNKILNEKKQEISEYFNEQKQIILDEKNQAIEELKTQVMDYAYNISKKVLGEEVSMVGISNEVVDRAIYEAER